MGCKIGASAFAALLFLQGAASEETPRLQAAYDLRKRAAALHTDDGDGALPAHARNSDEEELGRVATFAKGLPRGAKGLADEGAFQAMVNAVSPGEGSKGMDSIPMGGDRKLVSPSAGRSYAITGPDPQSVKLGPAPNFTSSEIAAEMVEVYWKALLRDARLDAMEEDAPQLANEAAKELGSLPSYTGARAGDGNVTPGVLFRGTLPGSLEGPHLSQFLYRDVQRGYAYAQTQKYTVAQAGSDFMTDRASWLSVQSGVTPNAELKTIDSPRYLMTGRDLATIVRSDYRFQFPLDAALVLLNMGVPMESHPLHHSPSETAAVDFGVDDILSAVTGVLQIVQRHDFFQKWMVHRRIRPEEYAGRVDDVARGNASHPVPSALMNSKAVNETRHRFGSALLPQAYPEGCPLHPAYPAGHAGIIGALTTILKAYFKEEFQLDAYRPLPGGDKLQRVENVSLTVGGELNKLADNLALGRDWAGIHYRSDAPSGFHLGEQVAIGFMADRARTYSDDYGEKMSFRFTSFAGEEIIVDSETPHTVTS